MSTAISCVVAALFLAQPPAKGHSMQGPTKVSFKQLSNTAAPLSTRIEAAGQIANSGDQAAVLPLFDLLDRESGEVRQATQKALRALGAEKMLKKDLSAKEAPVRERAAWALMMLPTPSLTPELLKLAKEDANERVREQVVSTLSALNESAAIPVLLELVLHDDSARVRSAAAQGLSGRTEAKVAETLETALKQEKDPATRLFVKKALKATAAK